MDIFYPYTLFRIHKKRRKHKNRRYGRNIHNEAIIRIKEATIPHSKQDRSTLPTKNKPINYLIHIDRIKTYYDYF